MKYLASIIIPCYNKEKTINSTIESLLNQTIFSQLELIFIDDCSTDKTAEILTNFQNKKYPNCKFIFNDTNKSVFVVRKTGINYASADYIGFVDADDTVEPSYFEEMVNVANNTGADIVENVSVKRYIGRDTEGNKIIQTGQNIYFKNHVLGMFQVDPADDTFKNMVVYDWNLLWCKLIRKDILTDVIYFPPYYINFMEDICLVYIAYMNAQNLCVIESEASYIYNLSNESTHISTQIENTRKSNVRQVFIMIASYIANHNKIYWLPLWNEYKTMYIKYFADEYAPLFGITEQFGKINTYSNSAIKTGSYKNYQNNEPFKKSNIIVNNRHVNIIGNGNKRFLGERYERFDGPKPTDNDIYDQLTYNKFNSRDPNNSTGRLMPGIVTEKEYIRMRDIAKEILKNINSNERNT